MYPSRVGNDTLKQTHTHTKKKKERERERGGGKKMKWEKRAASVYHSKKVSAYQTLFFPPTKCIKSGIGKGNGRESREKKKEDEKDTAKTIGRGIGHDPNSTPITVTRGKDRGGRGNSRRGVNHEKAKLTTTSLRPHVGYSEHQQRLTCKVRVQRWAPAACCQDRVELRGTEHLRRAFRGLRDLLHK